jgi:hypothetical protein
MSAVLASPFMSTDDTAASEHGADAETTQVPPPPRDEPGLAWSVDDDTDEMPTNRHSRLVWAGLSVLVVAVTAALILLVSTLFGRHTTNDARPQPVPSRSVTTTVAAAPPSTVTPPLPPAFSGRYTVTETWSNGHVVTDTWNVVPCGPKCVNITPEAGGSTVQGLLHSGSEKAWAGATDGQLIWTFSHSVADTGCPGSHGGAAFIIDAYTLSGTVTKAFDAACGQPAETDVDKIVLTPAN